MGAGYAPAGVAEVGVGEELEGSAAGAALEVMLDLVRGPIGAEEVLERAGALDDAEFSVIDGIEKAAGKFEIFARFLEAEALHEPIALRACRHCLSVPPSVMIAGHADGASVMLT